LKEVVMKPIRKQIAPGLYLSYLEAAPDHGRPELAVIQGRQVTVVAVGPRAIELFETMDEAAARAALQEVSADWD
jgi:hypothetical protein